MKGRRGVGPVICCLIVLASIAGGSAQRTSNAFSMLRSTASWRISETYEPHRRTQAIRRI